MKKTDLRTALVTGASRGIGAAIVERLYQDGVEVVTPSRQEMNLLSNESIQAYVQSLKTPIDILINNAGINLIASIREVSDQNIQDTVQINLVAPLYLTKVLVPSMIERRYGRIVNISSIWAAVTKAGRVTYSAAKAGLVGMTRTLAVELAPYNILVNAVAPGYVDTELTRQNNSQSQIEAIQQMIPIGRLARPQEIAETIAFLVSERNSYTTGQLIMVDGGYTCL
jgi:3-oxoacyl-[acyl-carrier protein] reductase